MTVLSRRTFLFAVLLSLAIRNVSCDDYYTDYDDDYDTLREYVGNYVDNLKANYTGNPFEMETNCPKRNCTENDQRICYYQISLEQYTAMGPACNNCFAGVKSDCFLPQCVMGDGVDRGVMTMNRKIPGPTIEVCKNDILCVDVHNNMPGMAATIHWHGILQRNTPYMDGVPYVTQCPIHSDNIFRYVFRTRDVGTQWYHSHLGRQRSNGVYAPLVVRTAPDDNPHYSLYDEEKIVVLSDTQHVIADNAVPGLPRGQPNLLPQNILINGQGSWNNTETGQITATPHSLINVIAGKRYLFRFINSGSGPCSFYVVIANHSGQLVAIDGFPIKPKPIQSFFCHSGQRVDVVYTANQPNGTYWMTVEARGPCAPLRILQHAVISYVHPPNTLYVDDPPNMPGFTGVNYGVVYNPPNQVSSNDTNIVKLTHLESLDGNNTDVLNAEPDLTLWLDFELKNVDKNFVYYDKEWRQYLNIVGDTLAVGVINNISSVAHSSPYLSQPDDVDPSLFCTGSDRPAKCANDTSVCNCQHHIKLPMNSWVKIYFIERRVSAVSHPIHLHGLKMYILNVVEVALGANRSVIESSSRKNFTSSLMADTINIPNPSDTNHMVVVTVLVEADNPGVWMMHCHIEDHMVTGMNLVFQVGEYEDFPPVPFGFPTCGHYV